MKALPLFSASLALCLAGALTACAVTSDPDNTIGDLGTVSPAPGTSAPAPGAAEPSAPTANAATKITIKSTQPLAMVSYREVDDPVWHAATEVTSGSFVARVRGPYWVTVVCQSPLTGAPSFVDVWRAGRTLDDAHEVDMPFLCFGPSPQPLPAVTGTFAQPAGNGGVVAISGGNVASSLTTADSQLPFSFLVPKGEYTLYGFNNNAITIQRGVEVKRSTPVFPLDLTLDGTPYVDAPLVPVNVNPFAFLHAVTRIAQADARGPINIFDNPLPARVVPNEVMTDDNQTVSVQADVFTFVDNVSRDENLASRRPWRLGDDQTFVEPAQISNAAWRFDGFNQLVARWDALPPVSVFSTEAFGFSAAGNFVEDFTELSPAFLAATQVKQTVIDTRIPGFQPGWMIDYHSAFDSYTRDQIAQLVVDPVAPEHGQISTSDVFETVFPTGQLASPDALAARATVPPSPRLPGRPFAR